MVRILSKCCLSQTPASSYAENPVLWLKNREKISPLYLKTLEYFQSHQSPSPCTSRSLPHTPHTHMSKMCKVQKNTPYSISNHKCVWIAKLGFIYLFLPYLTPNVSPSSEPWWTVSISGPLLPPKKRIGLKKWMCIGHVQRTQSEWMQ